jgi:hypothetical protein
MAGSRPSLRAFSFDRTEPDENENAAEEVGVPSTSLGAGSSTPSIHSQANGLAALRMTLDSQRKIFRQKKLRGRFRVPGLLRADTSLSASFSSLPFSWLPWFLFSLFHFSWTCYSNDRPLQLIECIESLKSDVKKKMMLARACDR